MVRVLSVPAQVKVHVDFISLKKLADYSLYSVFICNVVEKLLCYVPRECSLLRTPGFVEIFGLRKLEKPGAM